MVSYIYRLIRQFEHEHGILPNLLYLNEMHARHLRESFARELTHQSIADLLEMDVVIDGEIAHPHVAWTQTAQRMVV